MGIYVDSCNRTQNVTVDFGHPVRWVELVGLPVLVIVCTIGNILNITVMSGEKKTPNSILVSKSTKVFLISMAISDMILLWFQIPTWVGQYFMGLDLKDNSTFTLNFKRFYGVQQWGLEAFLQWSDWILIALSCDRLRSFYYITHTFNQSSQGMRNVMTVSTRKSLFFWSWGTSTKYIGSSREVLASSTDDYRGTPRAILASNDSNMSRTGVRKRTAIGIVLLLLFGALLFTMENGIYYFTWQTLDPGDGRPYHTYRPDWLTNWSFYQTIAEVAMTCAKFGLLLVLNISLIAIVVQQRRQARTFLTSCPQTSFSRRHSKEKTGRNLLIGCLVVYFVTHLPALVYQCLRLVSSAPYCLYFLPINTGMLARPVIRIVLLSNYSINFLLYFALSKKFREELRQSIARFRKCRCRLWVLCCKEDRRRTPSLATLRSRLPTSSSTSSSRPIVLETVSEKSV
ncbi:hypothetical protein RvY_00963 [Ramazzottius varieornatus]|uniref:G-protein coupled receptors family 1 profile domain-containing protein n=1 Tax=Ramazzottius varieornatus TaxID=947166 RepID=A0A1D1UPE1_RAMVA|nr:hypothetical protein RvY_00963 [Ramazzottius varieornatus]